MDKVTIENITWDYDLKKELLNEDYDDDNPIKNILMGKKYNKHIEYFNIVEDVIQIMYKKEDTKVRNLPTYNDIMNSFWTTYKSMLQLEYHEIFGVLNKANSRYDLPTIGKLNDNSKDFFVKLNRDDIKPINKFSIENVDNWIDFLLTNFDKFNNVHNNEQLQSFAKLTHTIGNITMVPMGFNGGRYNSTADYWDLSLEFLYDYYIPIDNAFWKKFIKYNYMEPFVQDTYKPAKFWENHTIKNKKIRTKTDYEIFLKRVNISIEERGRFIENKIRNKINKAEQPRFSNEIW